MKYFAVLALCVVGAIASPLSSEQYGLVSAAWNQVKNNEVDIFYNILKAYPDIQARFPQFVGQDLDSLRSSAPFATQAGRIVGFVSSAVALLGNESNAPAFNTLVAELGQSHKSRGIPQAQFGEFRTALTTYLSSNVAWNDATAAAWNQALDNLYAAINAQY